MVPNRPNYSAYRLSLFPTSKAGSLKAVISSELNFSQCMCHDGGLHNIINITIMNYNSRYQLSVGRLPITINYGIFCIQYE